MEKTMKQNSSPAELGLRACMRMPVAVITLTLALTAICFIESARMVPWSPYFIIFAGLTVILSRLFDSTPIMPTRMHGRKLWQFMALMIIVCCAIDAGIFTIGWDWFLVRIGLGDEPFYSMAGALNYLIVSVSKNRHLSLVQAQAIFGAFVLLWAPIGEELFYRGYVYNSLKDRYSLRTALLITCFLFALRHITHFFYLWETVSVAGIVWAVDVFIVGAVFTYVYERTGGLLPVMIVHFLVNVLGMILTA
jgi:membrane protease YdiL (CAAX protease family)